MGETITELMKRDHGIINSLLLEFEMSIGENIEKRREIFNRFMWTLEKHFFIEEKAVFNIYTDIINEEIASIFDMMQEHGDMIELMKNIDDDLDKDFTSDLNKLKEILTKHAEFEDIEFYPKLDEKLQEDQKKELADKIKEVVIG